MCSCCGSGVRLLRLTFVGELGFELHLPAAHAAVVYDAIHAEAADLVRRSGGGIPILDAGYHAIDSLSAEKSYRHWHADLGAADTPLEAGIGFTTLPKLKREDAVAFMGGDALRRQRAEGLRRRLVTLVLDDAGGPGGDALRRQRAEGLRRRLVTLVLNDTGGPGGDAPPLHGGETLLRDGVSVGIVRSTAYGHTLGRTIVTGYAECPVEFPKLTLQWLRDGRWAVGSQLNAPLPATLHLKPPFDPDGLRIQGRYD